MPFASARDGALSHSRSSPKQSTKDGSPSNTITHGIHVDSPDDDSGQTQVFMIVAIRTSTPLVRLFVVMVQYIPATTYDTVATILS
jgi:hypothetical protein